jgi:hypothetical protein
MSDEFALDITRPGVDVRTAGLEDKDYLFRSKNNVFKMDIALSTKFDITAGATAVITHSYGYVPMHMVWIKDGSVWKPAGFSGLYDVQATTTTLSIFNGSAGTKTVRVFLFIDRII